MNIREYKDWRMNGVAFETRLTTNMTPNRTMSSYIPGKKVCNNISDFDFNIEKIGRQHSCKRILGRHHKFAICTFRC